MTRKSWRRKNPRPRRRRISSIPSSPKSCRLHKFYKAENYHQEYYDNNSTAPYCQVVIAPKLEKLEKEKVIQTSPQTGGK